MKRIFRTIISAIAVFAALTACDKKDQGSAVSGWEHLIEPDPEIPQDEQFFLTRGVVAGWSDVGNRDVLDYIKIAKEHGLNTFSIYGADRSSQVWKDFAAQCAINGVKLEYEEHMMSFLLPRDLFSQHPEYFRMDTHFARTNDANGCPSNKDALDIVYKNALDIGRRYQPTNHKYYFWLDDGGDVCHCGDCKDYNAADQALIYENVIIKALKTLDPDAQLAHLCYYNTVEAPKHVKPEEGIFLEFAPIGRNSSEPLANLDAMGTDGRTHRVYLNALSENLKIFPKETAQVLEYWMDDSLFSGWDPAHLKPVPWSRSRFQQDIKTYASYGIRHIMCYTAYVGPNYVNQFGYPTFLEEYADDLKNFKK